MKDLRIKFGVVLATALFPILLFAFFMALKHQNTLYLIITLLVWLIGYFIIWISIDKLVFSYLRVIQKASHDFARGDLDARVGHLEHAPERIATLAGSFDSMAENISEREKRLLSNLKEKDSLLREIHHRVKNNLQIIISLLNLQERKFQGSATEGIIQDTRSRVNAIALVHRGLYEGHDLSIIAMDDFLSRLIDELQTSLGTDAMGISVNLSVEKLNFVSDKAVPVALFVVEALTNSVKHGVHAGGTIDIYLGQTNELVKVRVSDDGPYHEQPSSLGTGSKLMKGFARQLQGEAELKSTPQGFVAELNFKA
jgi:two-component sensor histidine kinase